MSNAVLFLFMQSQLTNRSQTFLPNRYHQHSSPSIASGLSDGEHGKWGGVNIYYVRTSHCHYVPTSHFSNSSYVSTTVQFYRLFFAALRIISNIRTHVQIEFGSRLLVLDHFIAEAILDYFILAFVFISY